MARNIRAASTPRFIGRAPPNSHGGDRSTPPVERSPVIPDAGAAQAVLPAVGRPRVSREPGVPGRLAVPGKPGVPGRLAVPGKPRILIQPRLGPAMPGWLGLSSRARIPRVAGKPDLPATLDPGVLGRPLAPGAAVLG